jgi:hypothetical protein
VFYVHWCFIFTALCTGFSTRAHIARAMLEAICFQTVEVLEAMRKVGARCRRCIIGAEGDCYAVGYASVIEALLEVRPCFNLAMMEKCIHVPSGPLAWWLDAVPCSPVLTACCHDLLSLVLTCSLRMLTWVG